MRNLSIALGFFVLLALVGCDNVSDPDPESAPLYYSIVEESYLQGWAGLDGPIPTDADAEYASEIHYPARPFTALTEILWTREAGGLASYDWNVGPGAGDWLTARIAREDRGDWAWVAGGWGELDLVHSLAPDDHELLILDPRSPLSFALAGIRWEEAGRPAGLDLSLVLTGFPLAEPEVYEACLHYEGAEDFYEAFHLDYGEKTAHFKLLTDEFPQPYSTLAEGISLQYWQGSDPPQIDPFAPEFPAGGNASVEPLLLDLEGLALAGERIIPTGEGPFPSLLMLAGSGPADRDAAALFGFLAHDLAEAGWAVYRFDKPGTGASAGALDTLTLSRRGEAALRAWQELVADPRLDPERRFLLGHGEGAALALSLTSTGAFDPAPAGLAALAPWRNRPDELRDIPEAEDRHFSFLGLECFGGKHLEKRDFDPEEYLPALMGPVLLMVGEADAVVPLADVEDQALFLDSAELSFLQYEGLGHGLGFGRLDNPPSSTVVADLLAWLETAAP